MKWQVKVDMTFEIEAETADEAVEKACDEINSPLITEDNLDVTPAKLSPGDEGWRPS